MWLSYIEFIFIYLIYMLVLAVYSSELFLQYKLFCL